MGNGLISSPVSAESHGNNIATSDETFMEAVEAAKSGNYSHALQLFEMQANAAQHDAQFNLALLLKSGRGTPQHYPDALKWAWLAHLGGIEKAQMLADEIIDLLPDDTIEDVRTAIATRLKERIDKGDKRAITQYARYFSEILYDPDYEQAYLWYSIASAVGVEGSQEARDEAASYLEPEIMIALQEEARTTYYGLSFGK
jgi:TPR repeat protein